MAGPLGTGTLDDFNRANSGTLGANWTADISAQGFSSWTIDTNRADASAGGFDSNWWSASSFSTKQEVFCTLVTLPATQEVRLLARILNPGGATVTAYELEIDSLGGSNIQRRDSDVSRTVIGFTTETYAAGDKAALVCNGTSIQAWRDSGAGWAMIGSATDATYSGTSFIGIWNQNNTTLAIDDFGGGSAADATVAWLTA